jgi:HEAT repeat protein
MKRLIASAVLLVAPLAALRAAPPQESARLDQSTFQEAVLTAMEPLRRDVELKQSIARQKALDYLSHLPSPVPAQVLSALAVAQSDADKDVSQAAMRAIQKLHLKLDVPALLLEGISSETSAVRVGSVRGILNLKLPSEQIQSKLVDALMKENQFVRTDVKKLITALGSPLQAGVIGEIQARYARAKDADTKIALLRALGSVHVKITRIGNDDENQQVEGKAQHEKPMTRALLLLADSLNDPSPDIRRAAAQTVRWLESPLYWGYKDGKPVPNVFRDHPVQMAQIVKALQGMLQTDASVACRAEAVGCLAELRQTPEILIAALDDKEAAVRSAAAQGLCYYERAKIQAAIPVLQKLTADEDCKTDAQATLGYIQDTAMQAYLDNQAKKLPWPSLTGVNPEELLAESARRAENAAKLTVALHAERIPYPGDLLTHFSAQLCLQRNRAAANARLCQELRFFSFDDITGLNGTTLPLVYALHHSKSPYFPGTFTPETEELFKQAMFSYVEWSSKTHFDEYVKDVTRLPGTENQCLQYRYGLWYLNLAMLNQDPAYASRTLRGGKTVAQYYAEWNDYMKQWMRIRALNGFWIELGSHYSGAYSLPAIFAIYAAAPDPELRQLTKMFIDLALVEEAQAGFGDVRGGSKNRIKGQGIYGTFGNTTSFLYDGKPDQYGLSHQLAVSGYRAPAVAVLLRKMEQYPRKPILIANRRFGEVGRDDPGRVYVADSKAVNYIWKTRHYMLGSLLRDPKTVMGGLYNQSAWNALVFADGKGLFPSCPRTDEPYFSFQHQNVFIFQRKIAGKKEPLGIVISPELEKVEENGWAFIKDGDAYAGVKILTGGYSWGDDKESKRGKFVNLLPEVESSPILIEAGDKDEFGSFEGFKAAVQANTITATADKVEYGGPKQPRIEFYFESTGKASVVDGKPFSPDPVFVYSSPFMQRKEGESIVTVTVGGKRVLYDFDKATITEADGSNESTQP